MRSRSMPPILWAIDEIYADTDFTEYRIQILVYCTSQRTLNNFFFFFVYFRAF